MQENFEELDIENRVILLAILKKEDDESLQEVILKLCDTGMFDLKNGKKRLKELKKNGYISDGALTMIGLQRAQDAQREFTI